MGNSQQRVKVMLDRPGALACGKYMAGQPYEVAKKEAERLIKAKGFRLVSAKSKTPLTPTGDK